MDEGRKIAAAALTAALLAPATGFALSGEAPAPKQNGGIIYQRPVDRMEQMRQDNDRRRSEAQKRTEALNKKLRAQQKKEAKAKAKAKKQAEKKKRQA